MLTLRGTISPFNFKVGLAVFLCGLGLVTSCETQARHRCSHHAFLVVLCFGQHNVLTFLLGYSKLILFDINVFQQGYGILDLWTQRFWYHGPVEQCADCVADVALFAKLEIYPGVSLVLSRSLARRTSIELGRFRFFGTTN